MNASPIQPPRRHNGIASLVAGLLLSATLLPTSTAQTTTLYTKPRADAAGGLAGHVDQELTHAIALEHDRVSSYKADLSDGGKAFRFSGLPTGKYDLIFVTKAGAVYEGVALGEDPTPLTGAPLKHLEERLLKADTFFNKIKVDRFGRTEGGEKLLIFAERLRDKQILKQSGEVLNSNLRRFEVIDLAKAGDDWQMMTNRHLYREEAPIGPDMDFFKHKYLPQLGGIRVIDSIKDIGTVPLPPAS